MLILEVVLICSFMLGMKEHLVIQHILLWFNFWQFMGLCVAVIETTVLEMLHLAMVWSLHLVKIVVSEVRV
jgi:hypothetical protein